MGLLRFWMNLVILILLPFAQRAYSSGFIVGNGGDGVYCRASSRFPGAGLYFLDYVMTAGYPVAEESTLNKISDFLSKASPNLFSSLQRFLETRTKPDPLASRAWVAAPAGLPDIFDEKLAERLPSECRGERISDSPIRQVIVRESQNRRMIYHYSSDLMAQFETNPLQLSYLMIHEWLWDHAKDGETVRILNAYFHSPDFFAADSEVLATKLYDLGFRFQSNVPEITAHGILRISDDTDSTHLFLSQKTFVDSEASHLVLHIYNDSKLMVRILHTGNGSYELAPCHACTTPADIFLELSKQGSLWIWGKTPNGEHVPPAHAEEQLYVKFR